jgi:regulator of replication initiation timing
VVTGANIDEIYMVKEKTLFELKEQNNQLKTENEQQKLLNNKLIERVELLQNIIDKEASANTFYYHYPPKPDDDLVKQQRNNKDAETAKIRKIYED